MKAPRFFSRGTVLFVVTLLAGATCFPVPPTPADAEDTKAEPRAVTTGSGSLYKTTVERKTVGELAQEDFQQVSLLGTRIVTHLNRAAEHLLDEHYGKAKSELEKAQTLAGIIREILPVTVVRTVVRDSAGKKVYHNTDRVQDDQIPIFDGRIAVEVMEPILDAKKEAAAVKGIRLADADLIHTSVLLDLAYVERKLKRCLSLLGEKKHEQEELLAELVLAQTGGVRLSLDKEDHPLVEAQSALRVAQRMAEQERFEAARANLALARNHLELYRGLMGKSASERVRDLDEQIEKVMEEIEKPGAAEKIGGFWDRLTGWFQKDTGVARATDTGEESGKE